MKIKVHEAKAPGRLRFSVSGWRELLRVRVVKDESRIAEGEARCPDPPCHEEFSFPLTKELVFDTLTIQAQDVESSAIARVRVEGQFKLEM